MTTAQVVETLVTVNNNSAIQDYVQPDDQTQPIAFVNLICTERARMNFAAAFGYILCTDRARVYSTVLTRQ